MRDADAILLLTKKTTNILSKRHMSISMNMITSKWKNIARVIESKGPKWTAIDLNYGSGHEHMLGYIASKLCKFLHPLFAMGNILDVYMFRKIK